MKRVIVFVLAMCFCMFVVGCGKKTEVKKDTVPTVAPATETATLATDVKAPEAAKVEVKIEVKEVPKTEVKEATVAPVKVDEAKVAPKTEEKE